MHRIITHILDFFDVKAREKEADARYLAEAYDIVDLERRMKILDTRGHRNDQYTNQFPY